MDRLFDKLDDFLEWGGIKKQLVLLGISMISLILSFFKLVDTPVDPAWIAIILCGIPVILEATIGLIRDHDITADLLVAIALVASVIIGEIFAAGEVAFIMQLGELLEEATVARARAGIEKLVQMTPRTARIISGGEERVVAAEEVAIGDVLRVVPGETVPVDGTIISGDTSIDQSVMTGESMPVDKTAGDSVSSGTVNMFGSFDMKAEKVGEDSSIQRMIRLVETADAGKAKIVTIADKWAVWLVLLAIAAAVCSFIVTRDIIRSVTVLVVFCPCALVLATPTAIMAAIGNATRHGALVSEGDALERLSQVNMMALDKTGTLTYGMPRVADVVPLNGHDRDEVFMLAASAESRSEHPLGKAITGSYAGLSEENKNLIKEPKEFSMTPGKGVISDIDGRKVFVGNKALMTEAGIEISEETENAIAGELDKGYTIVIVGADGEAAGLVLLSDSLRENAEETIRKIRDMNVRPVLLTGDHPDPARAIAASTGIEEYKAECLPETKLGYISEQQKAGGKVCMIGDGVNDAPALKEAHVGIAMGGVGSDIAASASDIVLTKDDISEVPHLLSLAKHMMTVIKANLAVSLIINFTAIILAMMGVLNPVTGALVHNAGSFFVILDSALLLGWKSRS